jgi:hypothetical protein
MHELLFNNRLFSERRLCCGLVLRFVQHATNLVHIIGLLFIVVSELLTDEKLLKDPDCSHPSRPQRTHPRKLDASSIITRYATFVDARSQKLGKLAHPNTEANNESIRKRYIYYI